MKHLISVFGFLMIVGSIVAQEHVYIGSKVSSVYIVDNNNLYENRLQTIYGVQIGKKLLNHFEGIIGLDWRSHRSAFYWTEHNILVDQVRDGVFIKGALNVNSTIRYTDNHFFVGATVGFENIMRQGLRTFEDNIFYEVNNDIPRFNIIAQSELGYQIYLNSNVRIQVGPIFQYKLLNESQLMIVRSDRIFIGLSAKVDYFLK